MKGSLQIKAIITFFLAILLLFKIFILSGCAVIIPPSGGPRDTLPPVLVSANPHDSTLNFHGNRIVFTFDEYIDLADVQNNLLFQPTPEKNPVITSKLRTLTIRLRDTLIPNTTYTFNFGNAIRDVNEANVLKNFTYVFSTGPKMDTGQYSGKVVIAENGAIDTTIIVGLYRDMTDSAVIKKKPNYVTRVDRNGNFRFRNMPPDSFAIYALGDAGLTRRYQNKTQLFAFADHPVIIGKSEPVLLYAYREQPKKENRPAPAAPVPGKVTVNEKRLQFTTNLTGNQLDLLGDLVLNFQTPLKTVDSTKISLTSDSSFTPVRYTIQLDSTKSELRFKTNWKENTFYNLILAKDFAADTLGKQLLKADTVSFYTKKLSDYGNLTIRVRKLDTSLNPVLQFVQGEKVMYSVPIKSGIYSTKLFLPGDYDLRVLYDRNGNNKWDPGQFFGRKKQPEVAIPLSKKISVKPAWDNEFEVSL
ncbi:MAG: Ig-like domain-containing protein [Flavisolibacter sp.]